MNSTSAPRPYPQFHLLTDPRLPRPQLLRAVTEAVDQGVDVVQVREKSASAADLLALVIAVRERIGSTVLLLVNDRIDVAIAANADGVHLGAKSLGPAVARRLLGPTRHIGVSVHSRDEAVRAAAAGATSVTFGHIFATGSHPGLPPRGVAELRQVVDAVTIPVIAIGGIDAPLVADVLAAGAAGIAVISAVLEAERPGNAARRVRDALDAARQYSGSRNEGTA